MNEKILIIHPYDKSTTFLGGINSSLQEKISGIKYICIQPNEKAHSDCLQQIENHPSDGLIIFMGHGRSDALIGSKGDEFSPSADAEDIAMFPDLYYYKERFIYKNNSAVFSGKKVFCLSCRSNEYISEYAIENGARAFFGFGNIPSSPEEFTSDGVNKPSYDLVLHMTRDLKDVISGAMNHCISNNHSFEKLHQIIELIINQKIAEYLIEHKDFEDRYILTEYLYRLKKDMSIKGDKKLKLLM